MSTTIDKKVVEMKFDNKKFEQNVSETMSTLDKLKEKLNLKGAAKGLEEVDAAAKKCDMSPLSGAVENVGLKFNAMFSIADQALRNITNSAMAAGKKIVSALTIDPIKTGFQEYETQINSVQTILANTESKGSTLQDVNNALAELNTYADKTIYNFTEMTRNIGTFTAAGVDLKTSVSAIKGIANLAAVSGSTSQQASTAMYQLSQALSSGTVKLMDWNSVVNAGMGGQVFQDALKETAKVHGTNVDAMIKKHGSFRETLQEGWITSEILTETLAKFTGDLSESQLKSMGYTDEQIEKIIKMGNTANDAATKVKTFTQLFDTLKEAAQSGWTKSWEILVGDFGEAKELLTDISDLVGGVIGASGDKRNAMLMGGLSTGWKQLLNEGIHDAAGFEEMVSNVAKEHNVDIASMIDEEHDFQDVLKQLLKDGTLTSDVLSESLSKFTDKCSGMTAAEMEAAGYTGEHIKKLSEFNDKVKDGTLSMDEFTKLIIRPSGRELLIESLWNAIDGLKTVIEPVSTAFRNIFPEYTGEQLYKLIEGIRNFTSLLKLDETQANNLRRTFEGVFAVLDTGIYIIKTIAGGIIDIAKAILPAGNGLLSFTAGIGDFLVGLNKAIKSSDIFGKTVSLITGILTPIIEGVIEFGKAVSDVFKSVSDTAKIRFEPLGAMGEAVKGIFLGLANVLANVSPFLEKAISAVGDFFKRIFNSISSSIQNADYTKGFDMLNGGIISAIGIFIAKFMKSAGDVLDNAGDFVENLSGILEGVGDSINNFAQSIKAKTLKTVATAIAILAASLFVLSLIDSSKLTGSLAAITVLFGELFGAIAIFEKMADGKKFDKIGKISRSMIALSAALLVLSIAMKIMSTMSWSEMGVGLISLTVGLGALVGAVHLLPKKKKLEELAISIKKLASSLVILALAIKIMSTMSWSEMGVGLISLTVGLGALVGAVHLLPKKKKLEESSKAIAKLSSSLLVIAVAIKLLSTIPWQGMVTGVGGLVVVLGSLVAAVNLLPKSKKIETGAKAISTLSSTLVVLAIAIKIMSTISWQEMVVGLGGMVVALGALIGVVYALQKAKKLSSIAAGLINMAAAMLILSVALKSMGKMSWEEILRGLSAIAGMFVILGAAAYILAPVSGTIIILAKSIALLGVGVLAAGVGVLVLAAGLTALAAAFAASGGAITIAVSALIGLIPYIIEQIGLGIIALCEVIAGGADSICKALTVIIVALVDALVTSVPAIVEGVFVLIDELLIALVKHTPVIVGALFDFLIVLINTIAQKLPDLIQAGVNLLMAFFTGVIDAMKSIDPQILVKGILAVGLLTALVAAMAAVALLTPLALVGVLGVGAVVTELAIVLAAIGALAQIPGLKWLVEEGGDFMQAVGTAIGQFIGGIVGGIAQGISSSLPSIGADLSAFMLSIQPFILGAKSIDPAAMEGVKALAETILILTAADIISGLTSWITGKPSLSGFSESLVDLAGGLKLFKESLGDVDENSMSAVNYAAQAIKTLAEAANSIPNDGGLAGLFAGENNLGDFMEKLPEIGTNLSEFASNLGTFGPDEVSKIDYAAQAITKIATAASDIPNEGGVLSWFSGDNSISDFGAMLPDLGTNLGKFITNLGDGVTNIESISTFISSFNELDVEPIKSLSESFKTIGSDSVSNFITAFTDETTVTNVETAISGLISGASTYIKSETNYELFKSVGSYLVDGFVEGIDENIYKAEAKAQAMASAAYTAAKDELGVESPSKEFKTIGKYVVEGFGKGITDNLRDVKGAASTLGTTMLEATQDTLGIHSPSVVFDKKVGRYIVQGVAEGIKSDMSAEDAAAKKAQNIVNAFKEALDIQDLNKSIAEKELNLWSLQYGNKATDDEKNAKTLEYLNASLSSAMSKQTLAYGEWQEMIKYFGDSSKETKEALGKYIDAQTEVITLQEQISAMDNQALVKQNRDLEKGMEVRAKRQELWEASAAQNLSEAEKDERYIRDLNDDIISLSAQLVIANEEHSKALDKYNSDSEEVLEAWTKAQDIQIEIAEKKNEIAQIEKEGLERERSLLKEKQQILSENATLDYQIWELTDGKKASDSEKIDAKRSTLTEQLETEVATLNVLYDEYQTLLKDKKYGKDHNDTKAKLNEYKQQRIEILQMENDIAQLEIEAMRREQERYSLSSEMADLEYQIWEKTSGKKATASEKNVKKLSVLSEQLKYQSEILQLTYEEYETIAEEYGSRSLEAQSKYKEYMQQQLEIANIQNDITDIQKTAVERQKLAKSDYEDYIEKYAKFYELNGMTREQLEKDAKLTSGYDPNDTVANMANKTNRELDNLLNNDSYSRNLSGFREMGSSYVKAVNEGVENDSRKLTDTMSTAVTDCLNIVKGTASSWTEAGNLLMQAMTTGIKNGRQLVYETVSDVANTSVSIVQSAIESIAEAIGSIDDAELTVKPVLDLSNVETGTVKLVNTITRSEALKIRDSMNEKSASIGQNGNSDSSSGTTYNFTQNNYSPKALSPTDTYRQTKNGFATLIKKVTQ